VVKACKGNLFDYRLFTILISGVAKVVTFKPQYSINNNNNNNDTTIHKAP